MISKDDKGNIIFPIHTIMFISDFEIIKKYSQHAINKVKCFPVGTLIRLTSIIIKMRSRNTQNSWSSSNYIHRDEWHLWYKWMYYIMFSNEQEFNIEKDYSHWRIQDDERSNVYNITRTSSPKILKSSSYWSGVDHYYLALEFAGIDRINFFFFLLACFIEIHWRSTSER